MKTTRAICHCEEDSALCCPTKQSFLPLRAIPWLVCFAFGALPVKPVHATSAIICDTTIIVGANSPGPYWLSGFFIIKGSEQVTANAGAAFDYTLDPNSGRIVFTPALSVADTLKITFQRLGFALRTRWSLSNPVDDAPQSGVIPVSYVVSPTVLSSPLRSIQPTSRLQWQGHKSFSVTASEGTSADWSQGMELAVEGELLKGLRLSAALSDRQVGTPASAAGYQSRDGSRLGDLDRFFIEAQSQRFRGRWGELRLQQPGATARRVSGLQTRVTGDQQSLETFIARPQGETRRAQITLREGELGPYTLSGSSAQANIIDGSQTVWLDGARLTEGRDADYTIDPARGTITLAPRVHFSRRSQLVVEYEESLDDYQRTLAGGVWGWQSADSSRRHSLSLAWEGDDPSQPLFGSLSPEQRDILARTSDGHITTTAAERVGDKDGDYRISIRPDGDTIFIYAGPGQGDWRVRFQWVGEGKGRYRHLVDGVHEYAGDGLGLYEPTLTLAAPRSQVALNESLNLSAGRIGSFALDWQGLGIDPNRFSSGSSRFHSNHALAWKLGDSRLSDRSYASLAWVSQSERPVGGNFGIGLARFGEDWRLRADLLEGEYDDYVLSSGSPITKWLSLHADAGHFSNASLTGWRTGGTAEAKPTTWLNLQHRARQRWLAELSTNEGRTSLHESIVRLLPNAFAAEAGWREEQVDDPGRYFTYDTDANTSRWLSFSRHGIIARQEWRRYHGNSVNRNERAEEFSLRVPAKMLNATSGSGLTLLRGERSVGGGEVRPYYGGRLSGVWNPDDNLQVSADFDLSHRRAGSQREVFIPTRPGQGDYRDERGEYIPDPQGDFRRVFVDDEQGDASAYDAAKNMRINWRPHWSGWRWTIDASRRIDARYAVNEFAPGAWLAPWAELAAALLPGARLMLRDDHRLSVQPRAQSRATITFSHERQLLRPVVSDNNDDHRQWRIEAEWREELSRLVYVAAVAQYHRRTRDGSLLALIDSDARALITTLGYSPASGLGLALETRRRLDREFAANQSLDLWGVRPSARVNIGALSGSLSTDFTWLTGGISGYLSPLLAEGRPLGFSFTESAEVRWQLPSRISLNARLSGDHRPDEPDRWRMHLETVAAF